MITGTVAIAINMLTIIALGIVLSVTAISLYLRFSPCRQHNYSARTYQLILWSFVCLPWLMGIIAALTLILFDNQLNLLQHFIPDIHWHHIDEFSFISWHGILGTIVIGFITYILSKSIVKLSNNIKKMNILTSMANLNKKGTYILDTDTPAAFTGGYLKPKIFLTTGMTKILNNQELNIVLLHETEHVKNKDSIRKLLFQLLSQVFPGSIAAQLQLSMILTMEQCADEAVTLKVIDKSKIAETLLKVKLFLKNSSQQNYKEVSINHFGFIEVEQRIKYLLNSNPEKNYPLSLLIFVAAILSCSSVYFAASTHHFIEYLLS